MSPRPLKICIVSVHAYPVINPQAEGSFGGIETRSWCFAKEIARLPDTDVTFVVSHRAAPRRSTVDRVTIVEATTWIEWFHEDLSNARKQWRRTYAIPWSRLPELGLKLLTWGLASPFQTSGASRWYRPSSFVTDVDADVYVTFGINSQSNWALTSAQSIQRPCVCCLASASELDQRFHDQPEFVNPYGVSSTIARNLIGRSDCVVAQNQSQQELLSRIWQRRDAVVINNPLDLKQWDQCQQTARPNDIPRGPFVLWVGRADRVHKRPLEMLKAIEANPQVRFVMVLNPGDSEIEKTVNESRLSNLTVIPHIPFSHMPGLMGSACAFAFTGSDTYEGQPNVLLQAAASRIPIISLETSAEWLEASGAGICLKGNLEEFNQTIARFWDQRDSAEARQFGEAGRRYVEREHDSLQQSEKLLTVLQGIARDRAGTSGNFPGT